MKSFIVACICMLAGCAQMIPARSVEISSGKYKLEASGNIFASHQQLQSIIDKKAKKLCGDNLYHYESPGDLEHKTQTTYHQGMRIQAGYNVLTKVITCQK